MKSRLTLKGQRYELNIYKEFAHDDLFEDSQWVSYVRGNGYWKDPVKWLNAKEIVQLHKEAKLDLDNIDGTFFILIQNKKNKELTIITDHLNFFPIYKEHDSIIHFSDSLKNDKNAEIDKKAMKQLFSIGSIIGQRTLHEGVSKLPPATISSINHDNSLKQKMYWKCSPILTNEEEFKSILSETINRIPELSEKPSLTFTAGLDSRMVFSELLKRKESFSTFTFGHKKAVDVITAKKIASDFEIPHSAYQIDTSNLDFLNDFQNNLKRCADYTDGMIPFIRGAAANYCFKKEAKHSDMIVTATGELVYSHYAEVPTLFPKDNSSIESIASFLVDFNADKGRPSIYQDLSDVKEELANHFKQYSLPNNILYYDIFYLNKLTGLTSYFQQFLSSNIRIYNPIFTKDMINHSMGLHQSLRDHRFLQRKIIVENSPLLNKYLVNGFKVVRPTAKTTLHSKLNYGIRLAKKATNRLVGRPIFKLNYLDYLPILIKAKGIRPSDSEVLGSLPHPTIESSESYLMNYLSLKEWLNIG